MYSRVFEKDKYRAVMQCIEKEKQGYECVRKLQKVNRSIKDFNHNGKDYNYLGTSEDFFWEAIYEKKGELQ